MSEAKTTVSVPTRVGSVDAYRGFVMLLMMGEVLELGHVARNLPESATWKFLAFHQTHVEWRGLSLHDMIQPSFSFLVGVAVTFSLAGRVARGESRGRSIAHAGWRAFILVALGIFLRSVGRGRTNYTFEDTLTQIGLGYLPLFLVGLAPRRVWWIALGVILVGTFAAFALYPAPGPGFDWSLTNVPPDWPHNASGFAAHWNKNTNLAWAFDRWFLDRFPRERPFAYNGGGYATLSFIPTLATMILGLIAGGWIKDATSAPRKLGILALAGIACLTLGTLADGSGLCPSVKRIWTPAWVLVSGGYCFLILAAFYAVIDAAGLRAWSLPLRVVGMNSIAAYVMAHGLDAYIKSALRTHLGPDAFKILGEPYEPLVAGAALLAIEWLILFWMYRRKIFLRI